MVLGICANALVAKSQTHSLMTVRAVESQVAHRSTPSMKGGMLGYS